MAFHIDAIMHCHQAQGVGLGVNPLLTLALSLAGSLALPCRRQGGQVGVPVADSEGPAGIGVSP